MLSTAWLKYLILAKDVNRIATNRGPQVAADGIAMGSHLHDAVHALQSATRYVGSVSK
jgi:hypothetical protein